MTHTLFIMSGLPGTGKSSLARHLAAKYGAIWLRIDTIELALRELCDFEPQGEGYRLAYRIAADNLRIGLNVVADSCNPWESTRREWNAVAAENGATALNVEVVCSDKHEHKTRVQTRKSEIAGVKLPTWEDVETREYHPWNDGAINGNDPRKIAKITIDTAGKSPEESFAELCEKIEKLN